MGHSLSRNDQVTHPRDRPGAQDPTVVMTRDQSGAVADPLLNRAQPPEHTVCTGCDGVAENGLWRMDAGQKHLLLSAGAAVEVVCPACRQVRNHLPEGVLTLRGTFWPAHQAEIHHLIRNQADEGLADNPLERIVDIRAEGDVLVVETTDERLAQRLGRALYRAFAGDLDYHWGDGSHLTRVDWSRSL